MEKRIKLSQVQFERYINASMAEADAANAYRVAKAHLDDVQALIFDFFEVTELVGRPQLVGDTKELVIQVPDSLPASK